MRSAINDPADDSRRRGAIEAARGQLLNVVNNFFDHKLVSIPKIAGYLDDLAAS